MLKIYSLEEKSGWDNTVSSFSNHDVYYLSGYVRAFQLHGDGEPLLFYYEDNDIRGINVVMKRDIAVDSHFLGKLPEKTLYDFSTPYGYGGWLFDGTGDKTTLFAEFEDWCRKNRIISEFIRFHPIAGNAKVCDGFYEVIPLSSTVALDLTSPEVIWANISSKNRNMIRKAQKNGVQIYSGRSTELFATFRRIYNETMNRDNASEYYYFGADFYESILWDLPQQAQVFYAVYKEQIIAASIMLCANGRMNYHLSGSLGDFRHLAPGNLLLYEAALWGCANGCQTMHLGGGVGSKEDNLYHFKKEFYRGEPRQFCIGRRVFDQEEYDRLIELRNEQGESNYFPQYRA